MKTALPKGWMKKPKDAAGTGPAKPREDERALQELEEEFESFKRRAENSGEDAFATIGIPPLTRRNRQAASKPRHAAIAAALVTVLGLAAAVFLAPPGLFTDFGASTKKGLQKVPGSALPEKQGRASRAVETKPPVATAAPDKPAETPPSPADHGCGANDQPCDRAAAPENSASAREPAPAEAIPAPLTEPALTSTTGSIGSGVATAPLPPRRPAIAVQTAKAAGATGAGFGAGLSGGAGLGTASVYCQGHGGRIETRQGTHGRYQLCRLPGGREIEAWRFYRMQSAPPRPPVRAPAPRSEPGPAPTPVAAPAAPEPRPAEDRH